MTIVGTALLLLSAGCLTSAADMPLSALFHYDSDNPMHPYKLYHWLLLAITIGLIVLAFVGLHFFEIQIQNH